MPLHFRAESGNVADDQTHRDTWDLLCQLTGRRDFLYVADCKLASSENMAHLHQRQGRFVTVLAADAEEDAAFRALVAKGQVTWRPLWEKTDDEGQVLDRYSLSDQPATTVEGYRLLWYHSLRKAEQDAVARSGQIEKALQQLAALREKLRSPRTRYRQEAKVAAAVAEILASCGTEAWIVTEVQPQTQETFRQDHRGRPGKDTHYVKKVATRFDLVYRIDDARVAADASATAFFPWSAMSPTSRTGTPPCLQAAAGDREEVLAIEDRLRGGTGLPQGGPPYPGVVVRLLLRAVGGGPFGASISAGDAAKEIEALPMYPEGRPCRWPTARRVLDLFESVQRHTLEDRRSRRGSDYRPDATPTQTPEAAGPIGQGLRKVTCRHGEIPGK